MTEETEMVDYRVAVQKLEELTKKYQETIDIIMGLREICIRDYGYVPGKAIANAGALGTQTSGVE